MKDTEKTNYTKCMSYLEYLLKILNKQIKNQKKNYLFQMIDTLEDNKNHMPNNIKCQLDEFVNIIEKKVNIDKLLKSSHSEKRLSCIFKTIYFFNDFMNRTLLTANDNDVRSELNFVNTKIKKQLSNVTQRLDSSTEWDMQGYWLEMIIEVILIGIIIWYFLYSVSLFIPGNNYMYVLDMFARYYRSIMDGYIKDNIKAVLIPAQKAHILL